jgi:uncharacterized DUF497 family protein
VLDLDRIVGFEWDAGNRGKNLKHEVSDGEAEQVFFSHPLLLLQDVRHSGQEPRYHALGLTLDGRRLHVTFTLRDDGRRLRVISARDMHRKERAVYEAKAKETP